MGFKKIWGFRVLGFWVYWGFNHGSGGGGGRGSGVSLKRKQHSMRIRHLAIRPAIRAAHDEVPKHPTLGVQGLGLSGPRLT